MYEKHWEEQGRQQAFAFLVLSKGHPSLVAQALSELCFSSMLAHWSPPTSHQHCFKFKPACSQAVNHDPLFLNPPTHPFLFVLLEFIIFRRPFLGRAYSAPQHHC